MQKPAHTLCPWGLIQLCERKTQILVGLGWQQLGCRGAQEILKRTNRAGQARIMDSRRVQGVSGSGRQAQELLIRDSLIKVIVHCIEKPLRSALRTDPDPETSELGEQIEHLFVQPVGTLDTFKGNANATPPHLRCIFA